MQVKQLLLKLKAFGLDITALQTKDVELQDQIKALQEQVGNLDVTQAIQAEITKALTEFKVLVDKADEEIKTSIADLATVVAGKADLGHIHTANEITETEAKQFVSSAKKTQYDENTIFNTEMLTVSGLGGIGVGEDLNDMPVQDLLAKLLYPYVAPIVSASSNPNGGTFEFGNNQTVTNIRASVNKKSEKITKVEYKDGSNILATKTEADGIANGGSFDLAVSLPVTANKSFQITVTDAANKVYNANTGGFSFVYPYYMGVIAADKATLTGDEVKRLTKKVEAKGNKQHAFATNNERMVFAYPKSHGVLKAVVDPNGFDNFSAFARTEVAIVGLDGTEQTYYVYINGASTVTNFTMKFNY